MRLKRSIPAGMERFMLFSPKKRRGLRLKWGPAAQNTSRFHSCRKAAFKRAAVVRRRVELLVNIFSVRQCANAANCSRSVLAVFYYPIRAPPFLTFARSRK